MLCPTCDSNLSQPTNSDMAAFACEEAVAKITRNVGAVNLFVVVVVESGEVMSRLCFSILRHRTRDSSMRRRCMPPRASSSRTSRAMPTLAKPRRYIDVVCATTMFLFLIRLCVIVKSHQALAQASAGVVRYERDLPTTSCRCCRLRLIIRSVGS